jgi:hypothetical protein
LKVSNNYFNDTSFTSNLITTVNFDISKNFKIKNLKFGTKGDLTDFYLKIDENKIIKEFIPTFKPEIILKNAKINFMQTKEDGQNLDLEGELKLGDGFELLKVSKTYNNKSKKHNVAGALTLNKTLLKLDQINYIKKKDSKANVSFDIDFKPKKYFLISDLLYSENESVIKLNKVKLNKDLQLVNLEMVGIKTYHDSKNNNDFLIKKQKKMIVTGETFDAQPLLKSLYKKGKKNIFGKEFGSTVKIDIKKAVTGTDDDISDFSMLAEIEGGSYKKLSLKGNYSDNEILEMSIYESEGKKTLQVISDRARPFMKNFDFIKGFEGGKLEYESNLLNKITYSNLLISEFKVSEVPALAQLLTLASFRGIADTLAGEGIHFDTFEMKSSSEGNILTIEDALAIGPAVSILLDGYVDRGKLVSLRGTLVPATMLNSIIASIPLVGDILVGKKMGEGVVGVSFKMKGPPKNIKTSVNPIKTLTPRFIVRAVENMKKRKTK